MDIFKEWEARPPLKPVMTLEDAVDDFIARFPRERRDTVVTFCEEARGLPDAVIRAIRSKNKEGKHNNHQSKINGNVYGVFISHLTDIEPLREMKRCKTFDQLHDYIADRVAGVKGIGPLFLYDVTTRIGAFLKLEPTSVYLHAGARQGAKALGLPWNQDRIEQDQLPRELRKIAPDMVEDFLCTYRFFFPRLQTGESK